MSDEIQVPAWAVTLGQLGEDVLSMVSKAEEHYDIEDMPPYALLALRRLMQAGASVSLAASRGLREAGA